MGLREGRGKKERLGGHENFMWVMEMCIILNVVVRCTKIKLTQFISTDV
jgi:hypothetical protein